MEQYSEVMLLKYNKTSLVAVEAGPMVFHQEATAPVSLEHETTASSRLF